MQWNVTIVGPREPLAENPKLVLWRRVLPCGSDFSASPIVDKGKTLSGIAFGLGFFMLQRLAVNLSVVYGIDLRLGYAIPPLLLAAYAAWTFRRA